MRDKMEKKAIKCNKMAKKWRSKWRKNGDGDRMAKKWR